MTTRKTKLALAVVAIVSTLLTCLLAPRLRITCHMVSPIPALCPDRRDCIVSASHRPWERSDNAYLAFDIGIWWVLYYGTLRGVLIMAISPFRLPFSRKRAYGDDPTGKLPPT